MKNIHTPGGRSLSQETVGHTRNNEFGSLMNYFWNYMDTPSGNGENAAVSNELEPRMQIVETKDAVNITAELPGIAEKDLDLQISSDGYLSLSGEKKNVSEFQEKDAYFSEISYGTFKRTIPLPWDLDYNKANAEFIDGALFVTIPKTQVEKQKFKKISINRTAEKRTAKADKTTKNKAN